MSTDETVSFSLEVNVESGLQDVRKLQMALYRTLGLLRRMGLSEDLDSATQDVMTLIGWLNQLRLMYLAVQLASGPVGWIVAGVTVASGIYQTASILEYETRGT